MRLVYRAVSIGLDDDAVMLERGQDDVRWGGDERTHEALIQRYIGEIGILQPIVETIEAPA